MTKPGIRRRLETTSSAAQQNDAIIRQIYYDDGEKVHASPFYTIFNLNRTCQLCASIAVVIFALAWARVSMLPNQFLEDGNKHLLGVEGIKHGEIIVRYKRAAPVHKEVPLQIGYLEDNKSSFWSHDPQLIQGHNESRDDGEDYFVEPMINLPDSFIVLYREAPDLNTYSNITVPEEVDTGGYVFVDEDFMDDFLVLQDEYLQEYFSFDDDINRSPQIDEDGLLTSRCRETSWYRENHPTCNKLHEVPILNKDEYHGYYFASGAYRNAFSVLNEEAILKVGLYDREFDTELFDMIRIDSMTMNILTASERIVNIYSHCGVSVHVEPMRGANIDEVVMPSEREGKEDVLPPLLSPTEKITTALMMAEALADLHGYTGGAIGHFDIQMGQYLFNEDGHLKLSDFNRAGPLMWNEAEQEYCRFWMGSAGGNVRSPEEYHEQVPVDYSVDVYSYGNVIFTLLTGEEPYGGEYVDVRHLCGKGITPKVDLAIRGRSFAEAFLATIMDKCFEFYPEKRIDIFTIVSLLKEAISINSRLESIEVTYSEEEEEELFQSGDENEDHGTGTESYYDSEDYNYTHYPSVHNEYREDEVDGDIDE